MVRFFISEKHSTISEKCEIYNKIRKIFRKINPFRGTFFISIKHKNYQWYISFRGLRFCSQNWKIHNGGFNIAAVFDLIRRIWFKFGYKGIFEVADYDPEDKNEKFKVAHSIERSFFYYIQHFSLKLYKNALKWDFEVADYDSEFENEKFNIVDSIWQPFLTKFSVFRSNCIKMNIRGLLRSLITTPRSKMKNWK